MNYWCFTVLRACKLLLVYTVRKTEGSLWQGGSLNIKWSKELHVIQSELKRFMLLMAVALFIGAISFSAGIAQEEAKGGAEAAAAAPAPLQAASRWPRAGGQAA